MDIADMPRGTVRVPLQVRMAGGPWQAATLVAGIMATGLEEEGTTSVPRALWYMRMK